MFNDTTSDKEIFVLIVPAVDDRGNECQAILDIDDSDRSPRYTWIEYNPNSNPANHYYGTNPGPGFLKRIIDQTDMGKYVRRLIPISSVDAEKGKI